ncbi:MAG: hypothetical protein KAY37_17025 [Phycisphaerae bacterium]|nr:hypothetical protein [Phycisphaerae bacterium]
MKPHCHLNRYAAAVLLIVVVVLAPLGAADAEERKVPERSEIEQKYLWATETIYPNIEAWELDFASFDADLKKLAALKGTLNQGPEALLKVLRLSDEIGPRVGKAWAYAAHKADEDTSISKYQGLKDRMLGLFVKFQEVTAWVEPEITAIPWETIEEWMAQNEDLALYRHSLHDLFRQKAHILPEREEKLLAWAGQVHSVPYKAYNLLSNADIQFPAITDEDGNLVELDDSAFYLYLRSPNREVRQAAYEGIVGSYADFRNTAAALLNGVVQSHIFTIRARDYDSCLAAALDDGNIPVEVYNNLVEAVNKNLPLLHRYQTIRRKALKLTDGVHAYDLFAPFTAEVKLEYTYEEAVELMKESLKPLGKDYCDVVSTGVESRWIDVYPTKGKRSGA